MEICFSLFWRLRSSRSRCQQIQCLPRIHSSQTAVFPLEPHVVAGQGSFLRPLLKSINSTYEAPPSRPYLLILLFGELRYQSVNFRGTQTDLV